MPIFSHGHEHLYQDGKQILHHTHGHIHPNARISEHSHSHKHSAQTYDEYLREKEKYEMKILIKTKGG